MADGILREAERRKVTVLLTERMLESLVLLVSVVCYAAYVPHLSIEYSLGGIVLLNVVMGISLCSYVDCWSVFAEHQQVL